MFGDRHFCPRNKYIQSVLFRSPSKWRSSQLRRSLSLSLFLFFFFLCSDRKDKSKSLVYRFIVPSRRRLHLESLPRGRDMRHKPGERIVRLLLRHRLQGGRLLGGHRRVRAGWVIAFHSLSISWKILLRSGLRSCETKAFSFFPFLLYDASVSSY